MDVKDFFLQQKRALRARTRQIVELIDPEYLKFSSAPGALSVGEILRHMAVSEQGVRQVALEDDFSYYETRIPQGLRVTLGAPRTLDQMKQDLERVHQETLAAVEAFPAARFEEERAREHLRYRRTVAAILMGINEHEVHHRAQLISYLRMLGSPAPEVRERKDARE
ncbi:MAG: DinB family protein [Terriglobales bacterium]